MAANPAQVALKWQQRASAAGEAIKQGVNAVTVSPTEKAAQAKDKYLLGVQAAAASGAYENGLRKVTLDDWKRAMIDKGIANHQNGVRVGLPNMQRFLAEFLPHAERVSQEIAAMPNVTESDAEARMLANVRKMREFRSSRR